MGELLRGKVTAYPQEDRSKGLVEVTVGAYDQDSGTILARAEQSMSGVYWLPELGDVVDVDIPDHPGCEARVVQVHRKEGDQQVSACWSDQNDVKQLKTRSGHTITWDDTQDKAALTIQTGGGLTIKLDDQAQTVAVRGTSDKPALVLNMDKDSVSISTGQGLRLECGGAALEIDSSGNIKLSTGGKLEISAQDISLDAKLNLTAKGQQTQLSGGMTAKISGQTQLDLSSGGITQVKGSIVKLN